GSPGPFAVRACRAGETPGPARSGRVARGDLQGDLRHVLGVDVGAGRRELLADRALAVDVLVHVDDLQVAPAGRLEALLDRLDVLELEVREPDLVGVVVGLLRLLALLLVDRLRRVRPAIALRLGGGRRRRAAAALVLLTAAAVQRQRGDQAADREHGDGDRTDDHRPVAPPAALPARGAGLRGDRVRRGGRRPRLRGVGRRVRRRVPALLRVAVRRGRRRSAVRVRRGRGAGLVRGLDVARLRLAGLVDRREHRGADARAGGRLGAGGDARRGRREGLADPQALPAHRLCAGEPLVGVLLQGAGDQRVHGRGQRAVDGGGGRRLLLHVRVGDGQRGVG